MQGNRSQPRMCMGAALHFDLSVHNFGIQEYMKHADETDAVFPHAYKFEDGSCIRARHPESAWTSMRASCEISVRASLPAGESEARWHDAQLVGRQKCRPCFWTIARTAAAVPEDAASEAQSRPR